jgi:hypothetical protein
MHSSDSKEIANSKCALAFEDNRVCEGISSAVNATCQTLSTQICKAARNEHNEKCIGSWKLADALKNGASDNMGETRPFPIDHYGAARKLLEDTADEMKTGSATAYDSATAYKGCFKDMSNGKRDLPVYKGSGKDKSACKSACSGYKYFGQQWTKQCFCGNSFGSQGRSSGCNCDASNVGGDKNCVYSVGTTSKGQNLDSHMNMGTKFGQCDVASAAFRECLNSFELSCSHGVGVNSPNKIPDSAITSRTQLFDWAVPSYTRYGTAVDATHRMWMPKTDTAVEWLQYDLGEDKIISGMMTRGPPSKNGQPCAQQLGFKNCCDGSPSVFFGSTHPCDAKVMQSFTMQYSISGGGLTWKVLSSKDGGAAVSFKGPHNNQKSIDQKRYTFPSDETSGAPPFEARYIRIFLETKAGWGQSSIQIDFYGPQCRIVPVVPVGFESWALMDSIFSENKATSRRMPSEAPQMARLNMKGFWSATPPNPWLQVFLSLGAKFYSSPLSGRPGCTVQYQCCCHAGPTRLWTVGH